MLLSKADLYHLSNRNTEMDDNMEKSKLERIVSYINEQKGLTLHYKSPNHSQPTNSSDNSSSSSVIIIDSSNNDDNTSLFSASISQVMARKRRHTQESMKPLVLSPTSINHQQKENDFASKLLLTTTKSISTESLYNKSSLSVHHQQPKKKKKRESRQQHHHKSSNGNTNEKLETITTNHHNNNIPQSKSNGFHLLHKFVSPNLEVNRITMKPNNIHKRPKLGLFNKGKSSSKATKAVPDLVFSESKFLEKDNHITTRSIVSSHSNVGHKKRNSISKYFKPKELSAQEQKDVSSVKIPTISLPSKEKSYHSSLPNHSTTARSINEGSISKKRKSIHTSTLSRSQKKRRKGSFDSILTSSSNKSLEKLLEECKQHDIPQRSLFEYNNSNRQQHFNHHSAMVTTTNMQIQQQVPSYSRVKTPISTTNNGRSNLLNIKQNNGYEEPSIVIEISSSSEDENLNNTANPFYFNNKLIGQDTTTSYRLNKLHHNDIALSATTEEDVNEYKNYMYDSEQDDHSIIQHPLQQHQEEGTHKIFYNNLVDEWQVENSIVSFKSGNNSNTMQSSCVDDSNKLLPQQQEQYDDEEDENILNFWKDQHKRRL